MAQLKKYDKKSTCRKCGSRDINGYFCAKADYDDVLRGHARPEHGYEQIHRECRNCGYEWEELPLDSTKR